MSKRKKKSSGSAWASFSDMGSYGLTPLTAEKLAQFAPIAVDPNHPVEIVTYDQQTPILMRTMSIEQAYTVAGVPIPPRGVVSTIDFVDGKPVGRVWWNIDEQHEVEVHVSEVDGVTVYEMFVTAVRHE